MEELQTKRRVALWERLKFAVAAAAAAAIGQLSANLNKNITIYYPIEPLMGLEPTASALYYRST